MSSTLCATVARYLAGELSGEETEQLLDWVQRDPLHGKWLEEVEQLWQQTGPSAQSSWDTEADWLALKQRAQAAHPRKPNRPLWSPYFSSIWRVAAVLLLLAGGAYVMDLLLLSTKKESRLAEGSLSATLAVVKTSHQVELCYLPDSSRVWLNRDSELSYPASFSGNKREVYLKGEAFFEVTHCDNWPFLVHAGKSKTQVLGTSFNVKTLPQDASVEVVVASGKVYFSAKDDSLRNGVVLKAGDKGRLDRTGHHLSKTRNQDLHFASWRQQNNPRFVQEKLAPKEFIKPTWTWNKNTINQTVIEGTLYSTASLASYHQIKLTLRVRTRSGNEKPPRTLLLEGPLPPRGRLSFRKRLLDVFTATDTVDIQIEAAQETGPQLIAVSPDQR